MDETRRAGRPRLHEPICSVDGCRRLHHALGLCQRHYYRFRAYGATDKRPRVSERSERTARIVALLKSYDVQPLPNGAYANIAQQVGVTRERVRQVAAREGLPRLRRSSH